ncbi:MULTISPECIES: hypothetical protein [Nocardiaceae]|uniref:hypothetical protein n=1 Tax=Nocardiaceae TaxID=85025 RepID=UPI000559C971|nr:MULTISPECIES: hypothetical protein [Rhodococcus]OZE96269.1 hypothetical protein CH301_20900 [Rhodococcus sp. 15-1189-1-1a]OZF10814.1 hypothetical protein CH299_21420 [Rhodococcus sp. 14-2686-1-2]
MSQHDWARASLTARGVPESMIGDAASAGASSLRSAARLAAAVGESDSLPLVLGTTDTTVLGTTDTTVLGTTGGSK